MIFSPIIEKNIEHKLFFKTETLKYQYVNHKNSNAAKMTIK
jgi:hypothetical protein